MPVNGLEYPSDGSRWVDPKYLIPLLDAYTGNASIPASITGILDDVNYAMALQNQGSGGALSVLDSLGTDLFALTDDGGSITNLGASGNVGIDGTAEVGGSATFGDTVDVTGAASFGDTVAVVGDAGFGANVLIEGTLDVSGATHLANTLLVDGTSTLTGAATLSSTLHVVGAATLDSTLRVVGAATFDGAVTLSSTLHVVGAATLDSTLHVVGAATFDGAVILGNAAADLVTVTGTASFAQPATFSLGAVITAGGLTLSPTTPGQRIVADYSAATTANRALFQSSVVNGVTNVGALPNGSGGGATMAVYSASNTASSAFAYLAATATATQLVSSHVGASYLPLEIYASGFKLIDMTGSRITLGITAGTVTLCPTGTNLGFFGAIGNVQQTVTAAATDLATVVALANSIRTALRAHNFVV